MAGCGTLFPTRSMPSSIRCTSEPFSSAAGPTGSGAASVIARAP